MTKPF